MHLAGRDVEAGAAQRVDAAEALVDPGGAQTRAAHPLVVASHVRASGPGGGGTGPSPATAGYLIARTCFSQLASLPTLAFVTRRAGRTMIRGSGRFCLVIRL